MNGYKHIIIQYINKGIMERKELYHKVLSMDKEMFEKLKKNMEHPHVVITPTPVHAARYIERGGDHAYLQNIEKHVNKLLEEE